METIIHPITEADYTDYIYNQIGETHDEIYHVGDVVKADTKGGRITGVVAEILSSKRRGIYQLKLKSGWCIHPNMDDIVKTHSWDKEL